MARKQFEELYDYKDKLMEIICSNEEIVKLITDNENAPVPNYALPYTQVFPFQYVPETVDKCKTFICFDVDLAAIESDQIYTNILYIWIFTHKSKMRLPDGGGVRVDKISSAIAEELTGNRRFGLGELKVAHNTRFTPITDFQGRELAYSALDKNMVGVHKALPSRRR
jgi:hypothetical protein